MITIGKIYICIFHFGCHYGFFLLGCRHNWRFIFNINFDNSHFKTNVFIEKALFVIVVAILNYSENISWFILRGENLQYTGHYVLMYNLTKNHGKRSRFFCFVPYKMGIIPFSNHISKILVLSPLFSFLYIKFMKNCCSDPFWLPLWNFSKGKITNFWYFWNNCPINFKMVYRFQYISTLLLIKIWFFLWTKKFFVFPQSGKRNILQGIWACLVRS